MSEECPHCVDEYAEEIDGKFNSVSDVIAREPDDSPPEIEFVYEPVNPHWGLHSDLHSWIDRSPYYIDDFSHLSPNTITLYIQKDE